MSADYISIIRYLWKLYKHVICYFIFKSNIDFINQPFYFFVYLYIDIFISFASRSSSIMGEKRGRITAVASHLIIDDEKLKNKNRIRDDLSTNK